MKTWPLSIMLFFFAQAIPALAADSATDDGRRLDASFAVFATDLVKLTPVPRSINYNTRVTRRGSFSPRAAAACPRIDFSSSLGEPRNQDGLNWCFGSVTADILSALLGFRVSDFDLSLRTFAAQGSKLGRNESITKFSTGSISKAVAVALRDGVCPEEGLPANDRILARLAAEMERKGYKLTAAELEETSATMLVKAIQSIETVRGWSLERLLASDTVSCDAYQYASGMFPGLDSEKIVGSIAGNQGNEELFKWLISLSCQRKPVTLPKGIRFKHMVPAGTVGGGKGFHLMPSLDRRLDKLKPVVVGLKAKRFFVEEPDDLHAAIIVGREFRNGKCKYQVRNSYGAGCGQYKDPYGKPGNCSRGDFWITEEDFHQTAEFIEFFE